MMFDISPSSAIPGGSNNNFDLEAVSRKRSIDEHTSGAKRARWYYRLESESSRTSEEDTESIYSVQGHETELVQDTPDTESKSENDSEADDKSDYDLDLEVEYEVASLSGDEHRTEDASSSGTDEMLAAAAAGAIAAVICDTSMEPWLTDGEDSDNSSVGEAELNRTDFWTCIQCKSQNNNPLYRYCQECFQVRKNRFPPRPRGRRRKRKMPANMSKNRKLPNQATSSQDSGIGSSQDFPTVEFEAASTSGIETVNTTRGAKRKYSSASESTENDIRDESKRIKCKQDEQSEKNEVKSEKEGEKNEEGKAKNHKDEVKGESDDRCLNNDEIASQAKDTTGKPQNLNSTDKALGTLTEYKELCIICNDKAKNSIFLHGKIGHMCSCYECAIRCWQSHKRCPACNRRVSNVVRVFKV